MKKFKIAKWFTFSLFCLVFWGSCQEARTEDKEDQAFENKDMPEEGMIYTRHLQDLNQSDIHFTAAIKAFEQNDRPEVVKQIEQGITALINEGASLEGEPRNRLMKDIDHLEDISADIQNGALDDIMDLQDALSSAELAVAHEYASDMNVYSIKVPLPDSYYPHFKAALKAISGAQKRMRGQAKKEANQLLKESNELLDRLDEGENITENDIRDQKAKMDAFLRSHYHTEEST